MSSVSSTSSKSPNEANRLSNTVSNLKPYVRKPDQDTNKMAILTILSFSFTQVVTTLALYPRVYSFTLRNIFFLHNIVGTLFSQKSLIILFRLEK